MTTFSFKFNLAIPALIGLAAYLYWWLPYDDTDPPGERSGLVPYTDHKTGCQYLRAGSMIGGSLTPRLNADGKQICAKATATSAADQPKGEA